MAKGYPDFFGTSIWPKYGTVLRGEDNAINVPSIAIADIISIAGPGVFYFFRMNIRCIDPMDNSQISLVADGAIIDYVTPGDINVTESPFSGRQLLSMIYVDSGLTQSVITLGCEVPFHDSIVVRIANNEVAAILGWARWAYYRVT